MYRIELKMIALLSVAIFAWGIFVVKGEARTYKTDAWGVSIQLVRKKPVEGIIWVEVKDGVFEAFSLKSYPDSLTRIPPDRICASLMPYSDTLAKAKEILDEADCTKASGCRFVYAESKPLLALIVRNADESKILYFNLVSLEKDAWQERVNDYLTAEQLAKGELKFDWRLVYGLAMSRITPANPVYRDLAYIDGEIGTKEYLFSSGAIKPNSSFSSGSAHYDDDYSSADDHILEKVTSKIEALRRNLQVDPADWPEINSADDIVEILSKAQ